jgi:hypothetical protein
LYYLGVWFNLNFRNLLILSLYPADADNAVIRNRIERCGSFHNRKPLASLNDLGEENYRLGYLIQYGVVATYILSFGHSSFPLVVFPSFGLLLLPMVGLKCIVLNDFLAQEPYISRDKELIKSTERGLRERRPVDSGVCDWTTAYTNWIPLATYTILPVGLVPVCRGVGEGIVTRRK